MRTVARRGRFIGSFQLREFSADRVTLPGHCDDAPNNPARGRSYVGGRLRRFDLHHVLVSLNLIADFDIDADDGGLSDGFAELRKNDRNKRHIRVEVNCEPLQQSSAPSVDAWPTDSDDTESAYP